MALSTVTVVLRDHAWCPSRTGAYTFASSASPLSSLLWSIAPAAQHCRLLPYAHWHTAGQTNFFPFLCHCHTRLLQLTVYACLLTLRQSCLDRVLCGSVAPLIDRISPHHKAINTRPCWNWERLQVVFLIEGALYKWMNGWINEGTISSSRMTSE